MESFLKDFGPWVASTIISVLGVMVWGRINDRFTAMQKEIDDVKNDHERITLQLNAMELNIVNKIVELKDSLDKKYVTKEVCAFYHKGE